MRALIVQQCRCDIWMCLPVKLPSCREIMELFPSGLGIHHAGMLRKHRSLMERAFEKGYLKVTAATGRPGSLRLARKKSETSAQHDILSMQECMCLLWSG